MIALVAIMVEIELQPLKTDEHVHHLSEQVSRRRHGGDLLERLAAVDFV